jgi:hypothetical protein
VELAFLLLAIAKRPDGLWQWLQAFLPGSGRWQATN